MKKHWIQGAVKPSNRGKLHKSLGVPMGKKIPHSELVKAAHNPNAKLRHRAQFALNVAR